MYLLGWLVSYDWLALVMGPYHCGGRMWQVVNFVSAQCYFLFTNVCWPFCIFGGIFTASTRLCRDGWGRRGQVQDFTALPPC